MRRIVQLWLPLFPMSPFQGAAARDLQRARKEWQGEILIYLSPDYKKVSRFVLQPEGTSASLGILGIPSETTNLIELIHIDEEGNCFPPSGHRLPEEWKARIPENLFQQWLNCEPPVISAVNEMATFFPIERRGKVKLEKKTLVPPPYLIVSVKIDKNSKNLKLEWPPKGYEFPPLSISPEAEIAEYIKPPKEIKYDSRVRLKWPEPFDRLFPIGGSVDFLYHHEVMKKAIKEKDEIAILAWKNQFVSTVKVTLDLIWTLPKLTRDILSGINPEITPDVGFFVDLQGKYDIVAKSLKEMKENKDYIKKLTQPYEIPCIFGWVGYFWWELSERAKEKSINICERCGNVIKGKADKRFCSKEENIECFRARRTEDKRRGRQKNNAD